MPLVYNSSGYDSVETLRLLDGVVDVYMPDFKFWRPETAERYAGAPDYPERARDAVVEMHRQVGPLRLGADGLARRGVLVRHLVMPGLAGESASLFGWLSREVSPDTWVNVMGQYRPQWRVGEPGREGLSLFPEIDRRPRTWEIEAARESARRAGLWRLDGPRGGRSLIPASVRQLLRNLSIRRKLTVIVMVTSGVAVILASALFLAYDYVAFRDQMVTSLRTTAEGIGLLAGPALDPRETTTAVGAQADGALALFLDSLRAYPSIEEAAIFDARGQLRGLKKPLLKQEDPPPPSPGTAGTPFATTASSCTRG